MSAIFLYDSRPTEIKKRPKPLPVYYTTPLPKVKLHNVSHYTSNKTNVYTLSPITRKST